MVDLEEIDVYVVKFITIKFQFILFYYHMKFRINYNRFSGLLRGTLTETRLRRRLYPTIQRDKHL